MESLCTNTEAFLFSQFFSRTLVTFFAEIKTTPLILFLHVLLTILKIPCIIQKDVANPSFTYKTVMNYKGDRIHEY